jgi:SAM-dependent methyltransferase
MMVHTGMPAYPAVLREVSRVLRPGGVFVHVGVHPCFCGGFADRRDLDAVVIRPGYLDGHWTKASWTDHGVRDKVGATHRPLPELLHAFPRRRPDTRTVRGKRRTNPSGVGRRGAEATSTTGLTASALPVLPSQCPARYTRASRFGPVLQPHPVLLTGMARDMSTK